MNMKRSSLFAALPLMLAGLTLAGPSAWSHDRHDSANAAVNGAQERVNAATDVVQQMKQSPELSRLLEQAHGVFVVPHYGKGAFIVGGQGGSGVVLVKHRGTWSDPAFYSIGGGSIGAQAGGEGGSVAMLLMTQRAVDKFETSTNRWSLNANAGLTVASYSGKASARTGADVIVWSNAKGLYGGLTASVTDITPDNTLDRAYYGRPVNSRDILMGSVSNASSNPLREALLSRVATR